MTVYTTSNQRVKTEGLGGSRKCLFVTAGLTLSPFVKCNFIYIFVFIHDPRKLLHLVTLLYKKICLYSICILYVTFFFPT